MLYVIGIIFFLWVLGTLSTSFKDTSTKKIAKKKSQVRNIKATELSDSTYIETLKSEYYTTFKLIGEIEFNRKKRDIVFKEIRSRIPNNYTILEKKYLVLIQFWECNPIKKDIIEEFAAYREEFNEIMISKGVQKNKLNVHDAFWSYLQKLKLDLIKLGFCFDVLSPEMEGFKREEIEIKKHLNNKTNFVNLLSAGSKNLLKKNNIEDYSYFTKITRLETQLLFGRGNININQKQVEIIDTILLIKHVWYLNQ